MRPFESQAKPFTDHAVGAVAADQIPGHHGALPARVANRRSHCGVVLREVDELDTSSYPRPHTCQRFGQHTLGLVLRQCDEAVWDRIRKMQIQSGHLSTVDVRNLPAHGHGSIESAANKTGQIP